MKWWQRCMGSKRAQIEGFLLALRALRSAGHVCFWVADQREVERSISLKDQVSVRRWSSISWNEHWAFLFYAISWSSVLLFEVTVFFRLPLFSLLYFHRLYSHLKQKLFILPSYLLFLPWITIYLCQDACFSEWQQQQKGEVMEILIGYSGLGKG